MSTRGDPIERLFFAALPDVATRTRIAGAADALQLCAEARRVPDANYHLTLAFVGEIPAASVPVLLKIGDSQRGDAITLRLDAYDYWPKPEVVVAAARAIPPALEQFWHRLHAELAAYQWALQAKRLRPHITLARKVAQAPVLPAISAFDWTFNEFALMRSEASAGHAAYTVVGTWPLLDDSLNPRKNSLI